MAFVRCEDRFTAFIGGIGSGKTYAGCAKDIYNARIPGSLGIVVAPTYPMLRDATLRTFMEIAGDAIEQFNKSDMIAKIRNGGEVLFRSADNPDRLRGPNLWWAHMDEICPPGTWEILIGRLRGGGKAGSCWITTTPNGRDWLYQRSQQMTVFRARTRDNPYLAEEYIKSLEGAYVGEFAKQELEGEFVSLEGLVYPQFGAKNIVRRTLSDFQRFGLCMDEGYTNPAVILLVGEDTDKRLHIIKEYYERGKLQSEVVATAKRWMTEHGIYVAAVDASAAGLIADLRDNGLPAMPAKGKVVEGIRKVQVALADPGDGKPRLTVDPSCENTINEFESYIWREGKDEPVKENDHALDAIRYYLDAMGREAIYARNPLYD